MQHKPSDLSMQDAMRFVNSPAGQQLLSLLQNSGNADLQKAMALAAKGELSQAKELLKDISQDPQVQKLLGKMGE